MRKGDLFADIADNPDSIKMAQGEGFSIVDETPPSNESPTDNEPTEGEPTEDKESAKPTARRGRPARN